ncbi:MAG: ComEA family DNA-binding protein, partial [Defluviitaleaceae bacterium]|nr:ComEA family DNA-binding protein [Defluviitaleaceae bacterium]
MDRNIKLFFKNLFVVIFFISSNSVIFANEYNQDLSGYNNLYIQNEYEHEVEDFEPDVQITYIEILNITQQINQSGLININTASVAELQALPGIGTTLANRIVEYRNTHGNFTSTSGLMNVQGIGQNLYNNIRFAITVSSTQGTNNTDVHSLININTATVQELQTLPGIGTTLANRIVEYRNIHGNFISTNQLMNIQGIGQNIYRNISPFITVGDVQTAQIHIADHNGNIIETWTRPIGSTLGMLPQAPRRDGYIFVGWFRTLSPHQSMGMSFERFINFVDYID